MMKAKIEAAAARIPNSRSGLSGVSVKAPRPAAVVALVAADAGQVLEFELGSVRKQFSFRDEEFPGRHDQGGWSQGRYQRHVDEHLHRNLKRLAGHLVRWADEGGAETVLLSGQDALLAAFGKNLDWLR